MATPTTIPVEVTSGAAAQIEALGRWQEFEPMIEHTKQTVPKLDSIFVTRYEDPDDPEGSRITIEARQHGSESAVIMTLDEWGSWFVDTFRPEVRRSFGFTTSYRESHRR